MWFAAELPAITRTRKVSTTIRVFLSSTFGDFQGEREALRSNVWPDLEAYCSQRNASFEVVDLRWGIGETDALNHDTLRICLDEVANCQRRSPKPNFLMMVGDRYGWRPPPTEIPTDEFELLLTSYKDSPVDLNFLNQWYRKDDNAIPSQWILLPRPPGIEWTPLERRLTNLLREGVRKIGLTPERERIYFLSATHQEILKGVFGQENASDHVFAIIRNLNELKPSKSTELFTDMNTGGAADEEAGTYRQKLRSEIRQALPKQSIYEYDAQWLGDEKRPISLDHIEDLCTQVHGALRKVIDEQLYDITTNPLQREIEMHSEFAEMRCRHFVGRNEELNEFGIIIENLLTNAGGGIIVHGPGGSGKSAFMSEALKLVQGLANTGEILTRFIGASPRSGNLVWLLQDLIEEICEKYDLKIEDLSWKRDAFETFRESLKFATPKKPLVLFLDGIDQLDSSRLDWLPQNLPNHVSIILSVKDGSLHRSLERWLPNFEAVSLPSFSISDATGMIHRELAGCNSRPRKLSTKQLDAVLKSFSKDGRPLFLKLACVICRDWRSWEQERTLPDSLEELVEQFILQLKQRHGDSLVERILDYLCASRFGISDHEMRELLWADSKVKSEFELRKNADQPDIGTLPPIIWSRVYHEIEDYLTSMNVDGVQLHRFFHRVVGAIVQKVLLSDNKLEIHALIADYFSQQPNHLCTGGFIAPNFRKLTEEPWQRIEAKQPIIAEGLVTDFRFIMAKSEALKLDDLIIDFEKIAESTKSKIAEEHHACLLRMRHALSTSNEPHRGLVQLLSSTNEFPLVNEGMMNWLSKEGENFLWLKRINLPQRPKAQLSFEVPYLSYDVRMIDQTTMIAWDKANKNQLDFHILNILSGGAARFHLNIESVAVFKTAFKAGPDHLLIQCGHLLHVVDLKKNQIIGDFDIRESLIIIDDAGLVVRTDRDEYLFGETIISNPDAISSTSIGIIDNRKSKPESQQWTLLSNPNNNVLIDYQHMPLEFVKEVVTKNSDVIECLPHDLAKHINNDRETVLKTARNHCIKLEYASMELENIGTEKRNENFFPPKESTYLSHEEYFKACLKWLRNKSYIGINRWRKISTELRNDESFICEAMKNNGRLLRFVSIEFRQCRGIVLAAVLQDGSALRHASEELRADKEIVLAAVKNSGNSLEYASEELRNDREIVLEAVKQSEFALRHASKELRIDREVFLQAITSTPHLLRTASLQLKQDPEVCIKAIEGDPSLFWHLPEQFQMDDEFRRTAGLGNLLDTSSISSPGPMPGHIIGGRYLSPEIVATWQENGLISLWSAEDLTYRAKAAPASRTEKPSFINLDCTRLGCSRATDFVVWDTETGEGPTPVADTPFADKVFHDNENGATKVINGHGPVFFTDRGDNVVVGEHWLIDWYWGEWQEDYYNCVAVQNLRRKNEEGVPIEILDEGGTVYGAIEIQYPYIICWGDNSALGEESRFSSSVVDIEKKEILFRLSELRDHYYPKQLKEDDILYDIKWIIDNLDTKELSNAQAQAMKAMNRFIMRQTPEIDWIDTGDWRLRFVTTNGSLVFAHRYEVVIAHTYQGAHRVRP